MTLATTATNASVHWVTIIRGDRVDPVSVPLTWAKMMEQTTNLADGVAT